MSVILSLPQSFLLQIVSVWLRKKEVGRVDMALCSETQRIFLLTLLSDTRLSKNIGSSYQPMNPTLSFMNWLCSRKVKLTTFNLKVDRSTTKAELLSIRDILSTELAHLKVDCYLRTDEYSDDENLEDEDEDATTDGVNVGTTYEYIGTEAEDGLISLLNSCTNLKSMQLDAVPDETLLSVNNLTAFCHLESLHLSDDFRDEYFDIQDNKNIPFMLTSKAIGHLSEMCHNLTSLRIDCSSYMESDGYDAVWKVRYDSKDLAKLIRYLKP